MGIFQNFEGEKLHNHWIRAGGNKRVGVLFALAVMAWGSARARGALVINLVFPDGSNSMTVTSANAGQDFPILVYGTVTGFGSVTQTPGATTGDFDGLQYAYYNVVSSAGGLGGLGGGLDSGAGNSSYRPQLNGASGANGSYGFGFNNAGSEAGVIQDINHDGIADLGSNTVLNQVAKPRSITIFDNASYSDFGAPNPTGAPNIIIGGVYNNSVSFLLETLYFQVGSSPSLGQSTAFNPVPVNTYVYGSYEPSNYFLDIPTAVLGQQPPAGYLYTSESAGTSVQFTVVPEPTAGVIVLLIGTGWLMRRIKPCDAAAASRRKSFCHR